jgi:aryl-alcohol dehydrogenase-like predicted oxidoreductase
MDLASGSSGFFDMALRFSAFAPGVSSAILGTRSLTHLAEAARIVARGPLDPQDSAHIGQAFEAHGANWHGEI